MGPSDLTLVHSIKLGDKTALDIFVRRWYPRIYGYVFKLLGHEQDSYDVTQECFIAMLQNIQSFRPWKKVNSWLFTIAHNKCIDYFRSQRHFLPTDNSSDRLPSGTLPLDEAVTVSVTVCQALDMLSPVQREAIVLHYFHRLTAKEIAELTDTPLPTVKSRLSTAKKNLSKYLKEEF